MSLGKAAWSVNKAHCCAGNRLVAIMKAFRFPTKNKTGQCNVLFIFLAILILLFCNNPHCMRLHYALSSEMQLVTKATRKLWS